MTDNDLLLLTSFLSRLHVDVEGRSSEPPPAEVATRLERFASGRADAQERLQVATLLQEHPEWIRYLANIIRQRSPA